MATPWKTILGFMLVIDNISSYKTRDVKGSEMLSRYKRDSIKSRGPLKLQLDVVADPQFCEASTDGNSYTCKDRMKAEILSSQHRIFGNDNPWIELVVAYAWIWQGPTGTTVPKDAEEYLKKYAANTVSTTDSTNKRDRNIDLVVMLTSLRFTASDAFAARGDLCSDSIPIILYDYLAGSMHNVIWKVLQVTCEHCNGKVCFQHQAYFHIRH